ncbi:MAG: lipoyl synthase [Fibrobacter sp.]|nr:lipoyl synthase [Fibrobacter sp.]
MHNMGLSMSKSKALRKPNWLQAPVGGGKAYKDLSALIRNNSLHTVCEEAHCPNKGECWSRGVATFMILGDICTRSCAFCNIKTGKPLPPDRDEPQRLAQNAQLMKLRYLTLTSVDRDDLPDQGAQHWYETIQAVKSLSPSIKVEALVPDFQGNTELLDKVLAAKPDVLNHNLETVPRLQKSIRKFANWEHSWKILEHARKQGFINKTGIMLGLGEKNHEVFEFIECAAQAQVDILTIGQYLQPSSEHHSVERYYSPKEFAEFARFAQEQGISHCESGPLVRSSWHAQDQFEHLT